MKQFKSSMAKKLNDYLDYRQNLGFKGKTLRSYLLSFDRYLMAKKADWNSLDAPFFLEWRKCLSADPRTINGSLSALNGFFQFLVRQEFTGENPLLFIPPVKENAYIPFIYSPQEVELLLGAAQKSLRKDERFFPDDLAVYLVILLMARCGLRISEPLMLLKKNYRPEEKTIYIEKTKFNKDRLIPIPRKVATELDNFLALKKSFGMGEKNRYLFPGQNQNRLPRNRIYKVFKRALKDTGIDQPRRIVADTVFGQPRTHSLRHSFAINTLKRIKEQGKSVQKALPVLAAYMGHRKYRYTSLYLKVIDAEQHKSLVDFAISMQENRDI